MTAAFGFDSTPQPRYDGYAGFVTTPRYFDDVVQQFSAVAGPRVGAMQRVLRVPDYEYRLDQRAGAFDIQRIAGICQELEREAHDRLQAVLKKYNR